MCGLDEWEHKMTEVPRAGCLVSRRQGCHIQCAACSRHKDAHEGVTGGWTAAAQPHRPTAHEALFATLRIGTLGAVSPHPGLRQEALRQQQESRCGWVEHRMDLERSAEGHFGRAWGDGLTLNHQDPMQWHAGIWLPCSPLDSQGPAQGPTFTRCFRKICE